METAIDYLSGKKVQKSSVPMRASKLASLSNTLLWMILVTLFGVKYGYAHVSLPLQYAPLLEPGIKVAFVLNALGLISEMGMLCRLTRRSRLADIPLGFTLVTVALGLLTWATCIQDVLTFILRLMTLAVFTVLWLIFSPSSTTTPKKVKAPQSIASLAQPQKRPVCSVCQRASIYEVCLECERTHQKEIQRVRSQNWRAKKANEPATLTIAEWLQTLAFFHYRCAYCQTKPYECLEHYHPIGSNHVDGGTTAKNCVPACHKCNAGKSNKQPEE